MKFMFVICDGLDDAADFFEKNVLEDFYSTDRLVGMKEAKKLYEDWGGSRPGKNQIEAIHRAIVRWNERISPPHQ